MFCVLASNQLTRRLLGEAAQGGGSPRRRRQLLAGLIPEHLGSDVAERAVRALGIVVNAPLLDLEASAGQGGKALLG